MLSDYRVQYAATNGELYAVHASNRGVSRKVRVFVDFLVELFKTTEEGGSPIQRLVEGGSIVRVKGVRCRRSSR
ncbi:hypothetical protein [Cupriavidus basilensis]